MVSKQRVLVTGGAGFLGSHLCDRLIAAGHDVICLDNYFTGGRRNIEHLLDHPRFETIRHDVIQPILLEVDWIFNLACPASPIHYQYNPIKTLKTSVMGSLNLLGLAKRVRARILQASTSEVYGDPEVHPHPATTRASAARRRCSPTTAAPTASTSGSRASSTPTGRAWRSTTVA
jgi:UDP-glucuronate decarboxylase